MCREVARKGVDFMSTPHPEWEQTLDFRAKTDERKIGLCLAYDIKDTPGSN